MARIRGLALSLLLSLLLLAFVSSFCNTRKNEARISHRCKFTYKPVPSPSCQSLRCHGLHAVSREDLTEDFLERNNRNEKVLKEFIECATEYTTELRQNLSEQAFDESNRVARLLERVEGLLKQLSASKPPKLLPRVAEIAFNLDEKLLQLSDLARLVSRVEQLFLWRQGYVDKWMAPYFPIVQSSGTGKTRLMVALKAFQNETFRTGNATKILLLVKSTADGLTEDESKYFDAAISVNGFTNDDARDALLRALDSIVERAETEDVVLMMDEAQHLLSLADAWHFRAVRWWLRRVNPLHGKNVVAIFTGTSSALTLLFEEPADSTTSRDPSSLYYEQGTTLLPPFFEICTIGVYANRITGSSFVSEFDESLVFGRPLFHGLNREGKLVGDAERGIALRLLLSQEKNWDDRACLSVLASRLQMGQTSAGIASTLVARSYAMLSSYNRDTSFAQIYYPCDPAVARVAMCLMSRSYESNVTGWPTCPDGPKYWAKKCTSIFSTGLCRPDRGDLGEIAVALYLLLIGDELRYVEDRGLRVFSIPFVTYLARLIDPAGNMAVRDQNATYGASVSFIQLCRNNFFYRNETVGVLYSEQYLDRLYRSGRALYTQPVFKGYDILAPIRYSVRGETRHLPFAISCKAVDSVPPAKAFSLLESLLDTLRNDGVRRAVCALFLVDASDAKNVAKYDQVLADLWTANSLPTSRTNINYWSQTEMAQCLFRNPEKEMLVPLVILVPKDDPFGITDFLEVTTAAPTAGDVLASHIDLRDFIDCRQSSISMEADIGYLLRSNTAKRSDSFKLAVSLANDFNDSRSVSDD